VSRDEEKRNGHASGQTKKCVIAGVKKGQKSTKKEGRFRNLPPKPGSPARKGKEALK